MLIAGILIETVRGAGPDVASRLFAVPGIELQGGDGVQRIAAVLTGPDGTALEALAERLVADHPEILGIFPTFVGDDEDGATASVDAEAAPRVVGGR